LYAALLAENVCYYTTEFNNCKCFFEKNMIFFKK